MGNLNSTLHLQTLRAAGTSEGAKKAWDTRGRKSGEDEEDKKGPYGHYGDQGSYSHPVALLPTGSRISPANPQKNEFHNDWTDGGKKDNGTYIHIQSTGGYGSEEKTKNVIVSGSGKPEDYPNVGDKFYVRHDQTRERLGGDAGHAPWTVVDKTSSGNIGDMKDKSTKALWVYK